MSSPIPPASHIVIDGTDPVLPARCPIGQVAASALAEVGDAARELSRQAGGDPGEVRTSVEKGAQSIISFAITKVDGEGIARTNQSNPFVRSYRCADGRWIFIHGGFPGLVDRLAAVLGIVSDASFDDVGTAVARWDGQALEDAVAAVDGCAGDAAHGGRVAGPSSGRRRRRPRSGQGDTRRRVDQRLGAESATSAHRPAGPRSHSRPRRADDRSHPCRARSGRPPGHRSVDTRCAVVRRRHRSGQTSCVRRLRGAP